MALKSPTYELLTQRKERVVMAKRTPRYRLHKASGQAVCVISGKSHYLGPFNSPDSKRKYERLIAEQNFGRVANAEAVRYDSTCDQLAIAFLEHARKHYRKNNEITAEYRCYVSALRYVSKLYGDTPALDFGPRKLFVCREAMIEGRFSPKPLSRAYINKACSRIRHAFKWTIQMELLPPHVLTSLQTLDPLLEGRSDAAERAPIKPVAESHLHATLAELRPELRDMVQVQLLTGMRPGELCRLRPDEINRTGDTWLYIPADHKMRHKKRPRIISIGPRAQAILKPRLFQEFCFYGTAHQVMSADDYRDAIHRACKKAGILKWNPNQIRHLYATKVAAEFDTETAKTLLGHKDERVTQIYAERDMRRVHHAARAIG